MKRETMGKMGKISYAAYFAGQICFYSLVGMYVSTFMTDIGISLAAVGLILELARVWDAINDPIFGVIVDKTKWKSGRKYLPWIKISTGLITAFTIAIFVCPASMAMDMKTAWVGLAYICWGMSYTMCDIPIYALPTTMTDDTKERSVIISYGRMACTVAGSIINLLFPILRSTLGWTVTGIIFAIVGCLLMLPAGFNIHEKETIKSSEKINLSSAISGLLKNKYLIIYYIGYLVMGCVNFQFGVALYFARYCLGNEAKASIVSLATMIPSFIVMFLIPIAIKKFDKFRIYHVCLILAAAIGFIRYFAGYENASLFYGLLVIQGLFTAVTGMMQFMFTPDLVEYGIFINGPGAEGIMFSIQTFSGKLVSAIGGALSMLFLGLYGFQTGENVVQTATAVNGIWACSVLFPSIGMALSAVVLILYKLRDNNVQIMALANNGSISREEAIRKLNKIGWNEHIANVANGPSAVEEKIANIKEA